jgi:cytochrome c551/c552
VASWKACALAGLAVAGACAGKDKGASPPGGSDAVVQPAAMSDDPRAALFLQKGCPKCHSISALGVKAATEVGPDLTFAYSDVKSRFNQPLEQFLQNPTGTMQIVLSQMITLSPEERDSVIHILKRLHDEREERGEH